MTAIKFRSGATYDRAKGSQAGAVSFKGAKNRTIQSAKDECDINRIVARFGVTGVLPVSRRPPPTYQEFNGVFDYQSAMNVIRGAQEAFATLPAKVRYRFHNNPQEYLEFVSNPENADEMVKLGLAEKKPKPKIVSPRGADDKGDDDGDSKSGVGGSKKGAASSAGSKGKSGDSAAGKSGSVEERD